MTTDGSWAELEARVAALESRLSGEAAPTVDADTFWVLTGLREQLREVPAGGVVLAGTVRTAAGPAEWQYTHRTEDLLDNDEATRTGTAERLAALGHPIRLQLLQAVLDGHTSPTGLAELDGMGTTGQVYHHLRILSTAGWLRSSRRNHVEVPPERVVPLLAALAAVR